MSARTRVRLFKPTLGITTFFLLMQTTHWPPLRFWGWWGGGNFFDSWQVLKAGDCYNSIGLAVYEADNSCMVYAYGRPLLWLMRIFHIGTSQTSFFGISFILILSLSISLMIQSLNVSPLKKNFLIATIVLSPPVLLLGDRGNFDSLTLGALLLALLFLNRNKPIYALIIIFIVTLFKYYSLPLILIVAIFNSKLRVRITAGVFLVVAIISIRRDLAITEFNFTSKTPHLTFGLGHEFLFFGNYDALNWVEVNSRILGLLVVLLATLMSYYFLNKNFSFENISFTNLNMVRTYIISTTVVLTCYISGFNADYRLIFFVFSALSLSQLVAHYSEFSNGIFILMAIILWLTFPSGDLEIIGDFSLTIYIGLNIALVLQLIRSGKIKSLVN